MGMDVRITERWGDGRRGCREEHQFKNVVPANLLVFSSLLSLFRLSLSPAPLTSSPFISCSVKAVKEAAWMKWSRALTRRRHESCK